MPFRFISSGSARRFEVLRIAIEDEGTFKTVRIAPLVLTCHIIVNPKREIASVDVGRRRKELAC